MSNKKFCFFFLLTLVIFINADEGNPTENTTQNLGEGQQPSKHQNTKASRQNRLYIQSTIDNKDYIIFQPQSIESILKMTGQYPQYVTTTKNEIYISDLIDAGMNTGGSGILVQPQYQIIPSANNGEVFESFKPSKYDGIEVPLIPEDHFTSESEPIDNAEAQEELEPEGAGDYDYENKGDDNDDDGDDDYENETQELEKPNPDSTDVLKELEKLERKWLRRHEALRRKELEFRREQAEFHRRQSVLARRDAIRQQEEEEGDRLIAYRRKRRRENLNKSQNFALKFVGR